jgi:hypothetical protein
VGGTRYIKETTPACAELLQARFHDAIEICKLQHFTQKRLQNRHFCNLKGTGQPVAAYYEQNR